MSQVTLDPKTKKIMDLVAPQWTEILTNVNFEGQKLIRSLRNRMNTNQYGCLFGEIYSYDGSYEGCYICKCLSMLAPYVFDTIHNEIITRDSLLNNLLDEGFEFEDGYKFGNNVSLDQFLNGMIRHMENRHKNILVNKTTN